MAAKVTRLRTPPARTLRTAAEAFLDTIGSPNTRRAYGIAIVKTVDALDGPGPGPGPDGLIGRSRALDSVTDAEIGAALKSLWGQAAVILAENLRRYFKPSPQAMRDLTALLGPGSDRRR
ncbi:hypothetical protein [Nocardia aurantiaca]|uniref:hypothetical protein n=1 Tax=Nocardia aurantiaca TaxID=2675850 RepID=UPI0018AAA784|nr:hypothetical protein [Nocardia aurantiaca]